MKFRISKLRFKIFVPKVSFSWRGFRKVTVRFLLMFCVNLFTVAIGVFVVAGLLVYEEREITCKDNDTIETLDELYKLKIELVQEKEIGISEAAFYDEYNITSEIETMGLDEYIYDKTRRDIKMGQIHGNIDEIDGHIESVKKCDFYQDNIYKRIDAIRDSIFNAGPSTQKS